MGKGTGWDNKPAKKEKHTKHVLGVSNASGSCSSTSKSKRKTASTIMKVGCTGLWYQRTKLLASLVLAGQRFEAERLAMLFFQGSNNDP